MAVSKYNADAIEQCRTMASTQASQFGGLGDGFAHVGGNAAIFGKLANSAGLSAAVDSLNGTAAAEFAAAERLLGKVERALDAVLSSVGNVEDANRHTFRRPA
ncbi:hypothetical protein [Gandjariella thermophila]|uniref:Uncharacterized protein n=1 Tax=Gandjariella thermophila TaxID=1931992 RepID=A0A4D4JCE6_9PSEU|nr:hypothetical protein [Gandjariella thermophila]GDY32116.1 hypothetical protein GTS_37490 [Gandjariella thermophila]